MYVQRIKAKEPVDESWKKQIVHSVNNYLKAHNPGIEIVDLDEDRLNKWEYTNKFSKSQIKATTAKILALPAAGPSAPLTPTTVNRDEEGGEEAAAAAAADDDDEEEAA